MFTYRTRLLYKLQGGSEVMKKVYRTTQVILVVLFIGMIMAIDHSSTTVNVLGIIGIAVSLFQIYLHNKLKRDNDQD